MAKQPERPKRVTRPPVRLVAVENASGVRRNAITAAKPRKFFRRNIIANHRVLKIGAPIDVHRARNMPGVVEQNVFIGLDDTDSFIIEMFLQPVGLNECFRMRVFSWMRSHREISAGLRTEQGILVCGERTLRGSTGCQPVLPGNTLSARSSPPDKRHRSSPPCRRPKHSLCPPADSN